MFADGVLMTSYPSITISMLFFGGQNISLMQQEVSQLKSNISLKLQESV